jgi:hypothetical protein
MLATASLSSVRWVVRALGELPGRKAVVLFSEGLRLYEDETDRRAIIDPGAGTRFGRHAERTGRLPTR